MLDTAASAGSGAASAPPARLYIEKVEKVEINK
jgi:hypothetical protein